MWETRGTLFPLRTTSFLQTSSRQDAKNTVGENSGRNSRRREEGDKRSRQEVSQRKEMRGTHKSGSCRTKQADVFYRRLFRQTRA